MNLSFSRCMLIIISIIYSILLLFPKNNYAEQQASKDTYYQIDSKLYNSDLINLLSYDIINKTTVFSSIRNSIYDVPNSLTALAFNKFLRPDQKQRLILFFLSQIYSKDTYSRLSYMDTFREIIMTNDSTVKDIAYFGLYLAERWYKANALNADNSIDDTIFLSLLQTYFAEKDISTKRKLQNWLVQNSFINSFNPFFSRDKLNEFYSIIYNNFNLTIPSFSTSNIYTPNIKINDTIVNKVIQFCTLIRTNKKNKTMDDLTFELQNIFVDGHAYVKIALLRNILFQIESEKDGLLLPDSIVSELLKIAFEDQHPLVRVLSLTCLVRNNYENRYAIVKSFISKEKDFYSKSMAIELLASVSWEKDTVNFILDGCRSEVNAVVRLHWVWVITYTWNKINNRQSLIQPLIDINDNESNKYILRALLTFFGREKISEAKTSITNLIGKYKDFSNVQIKCYEALWKIDNCPDKISLYAKSLSEKLSAQNNIQTSPEVLVWLEFYDENKKHKKIYPEIVQEPIKDVESTKTEETFISTTPTTTEIITPTYSSNELPEPPEIVEIFTSKSEEKKAAPMIGSKSSVEATTIYSDPE